MSLARATLGNRHLIWALSIAVAVFGAIAYATLPMQLFPDTAPPVVNVVTAYPGAAAEDVAENLSRPLEEELASLEGALKVKSASQDDLSLVTVEFHYDRDVDLAAVDAQNAISRVRGKLPRQIGEPQVLKLSTNDRPIVSVGARADDPLRARRLAEDVVAPRLQRIEGVAAVDVFGGAVEAVLVELDPRRLEAYQIPFDKVVGAVASHEATEPAGRIRTETTRTSLRVEARARSMEALGSIPIGLPDGSERRLADLGTLRRGSLDDEARFAVDGERAIALQVFKSTEANTVEVVGRVQAALGELRAEHPDLELVVGEESASFTETSISNLLGNVWQALLLAAVIIFLFIGKVRSSLVAAVSMPLAYGLTFALMKLTDVEFNLVTLSAVILAVGMVVDASVVVLENVMRHRDAGASAEDAAANGADEVRLPVIAGTLTTVVVLVPLVFLGGFVGKTFGPLALTLLFAFTSSVAVALVLVPTLTVYAGPSRLDRVGLWVARPFQWVMDQVREGYVWLLRRALRQRVLTVGVAVGLTALGVLALRRQGAEVLPKMDGGSFFVSLETPSGTSLDETERVVREVEGALSKEPEVVTIQSQIGFEPGMRSFSQTGAQGPTQGFVSVTLTPRTDRSDTIWQIEERTRQRLAKIPGIRSAVVRELGNTAKSTTAAPVAVRVSGPDFLVIDALGDEIRQRLESVPGVVEPVRNWRLDERRVNVIVARQRAERLGVPPSVVAAAMRRGSEGARAGEFYGTSSDSVPVLVRYERQADPRPEDLLDLPVLGAPGASAVPLRSVARLDEHVGRALVTREQFVPSLELTAFTADRALSFVTADVAAMLESETVPRGYSVDLTGESSDLAEAKRELGGALGISIIAVYLLLVAQLRSFLHPLVIMTTVPLTLSGVGVALAVAGRPVSMPVMVGLILLVGTVVNSAIILFDFVHQSRKRGVAREEALLQAVRTRFRPIMMTSLSTIVGMIPLAGEWALGAERFSPLATAVIGGMVTATLLTLIVIPALYDLVDDAKTFASRMMFRLRRRPAGA